MKRQSDKKQGSRIAELEKELEIEASLERVRAQAMRMTRPDELLGICEILFTELEKLGFNEIRNSQIFIYNDHKESFMNYGFSVYEGAALAEIYYTSHPKVDAFVTAVRKTNDAFAELAISGDELKAWRDYRIENGEPDDPRLAHIDTLYYYFYSIGAGAIGISNFESISAAQLEVLKRFRNVFDFAYRRYTDVSQAEAQAREAQIELGLERVRSRAMAMHKTDELRGAAELLYKELVGLGIGSITVCYVLVNEKDKTGAYYGANPIDGKIPSQPTIMPHTETKVMRALRASWLKQEPVHFIVLDPKASLAHQTYIGKLIAAQGNIPGFTAEGFLSVSPERVHIYSLNFKQGYLFLVGGAPLPASDVDILIRFTKVFELTYTRFLDLKNAEAQAREAQTELALERVRARTMAMQHSDELAETAYILFQQFRELGENPDQATIGIINEAEGVIEYWVTIHGNQTDRVYKFPTDEPNVTHKIYKAWKKHEKSLVIDLSGKALHDFSKFRESMGGAGYNPEEKRRIINVAFFSKGLLNVQSPVERSIESLRLLERFANVFESTYTRFLDLKKAEAQAREAQIELALERVRARAMAMRDSKELSDMVSTVFDELTKLDFALTRCAIVIADADSSGRMIWMANSEAGQPPISFYRKSLDHPYPNAADDEWKKRNPKWVYHLKGAEKKAMDDYYANSEEVAHMPSVIRRAMDLPESIMLSHSFNNFGYLRADSLEPLSEANLDILYRFAKVFDLGYTRFTDIKQAEAQAREAQIELALERVRAKTMAMQHSNELLETSQVVFQQLRDLGETADQIGIAIVKEDEGVFDLFATLYGTQMVRVFQPKIDDHFIMGRVYKNWKAHKKSFVVELGGEELRQYNILRNQLGGQNYYNENIGPDDRWIVSCASFSKGILSFSSSTEPTQEATQLLARFALVFEQTYTRFLDLKKAEAQAREADIELGLERVRARTMAMQKSDELQEIIKVVYEQLVHLNILVEHAGFIMDYNTRDDMHIWLADKHYAPTEITIPYFDSPHWNSFIEAKQKGTNFFANYLDFEVKNKFYQDLFKLVPGVTDETMAYYMGCPGLAGSTVLMENVGLYIENFAGTPYTDDENATLMRFGKVFQQTYTRFLDLKHAEEQAREAQIQLAMERVRARTMAMQKSDELAETVSLLFKQLLALGIHTEQIRTCGIVTFDDKKPMGEQWITETNGEIIPQSFMVPYDKAPAYKAIYKAWKQGEQFMVIHLEGEALKEHLGYLAKGTNVPTRDVVLPQQAKEIFNHVMFFSQGCLFIITKEALHDYHDVFKRFGAVFQQSYTRFLDLKKAEEQARESQIETALERVRSRTMGMQHSNELREVIQVIYEQFIHLGLDITSAGFTMDYKERDDWHIWAADSAHSFPSLLHIPYFDHPHWNRFNEAKRKGLDAFASTLTFEEKNSLYEQYSKYVPDLPERAKEYIYSTPGYTISNTFLKNVALFVDRFSTVPFSDADNAIVQRFGKVFEQTYTRFKDLEQAEEQAREAQIELGLERVRARAMAMQNSGEINDLIGAVFYELTKLDLIVTRCRLWIFDPASLSCMTWQANQETPAYPLGSFIKYNEQPFYLAILKSWKEGSLKLVYELKGGEKKSWDEFLFNETEFSRLPEVVKEGMRSPERVLLSASFGNFGAVQTGSLDPLSDKQMEILSRFVKVFDMSYTRFNDLKQAEAQSREAQIQLALERVRARTMAMQKSEELAETATVLFQQLLNLGISSERTFIGMPNDETRKIELWGTEQGGYQMSMRFEYEADATYAFREIYKAWQEKRSELTVILKGKNLDEHVNYVRNVLHMPLLIGLVQKQRILYNAFFSKGLLMIVTPDAQSKETLEILERFAGVFDGTYTRFLDLQKAEAQGRESQIQLALERVRARTMAMQKSDELVETAMALFQQFSDLGVKPERIFIGNMDENTRMIEFWGTDLGGEHPRFEVNADATIGFSQIYKAWKAKKKTHTVIMKGRELADHVRYVQDVLHMPMQPELVQRQRIMYSAFFSKGLLMIVTPEIQSNETLGILERFAGVFDGTYTRFLDLQKAESQARESQIQLALERVRARTMAMQKSEELAETASVLFQQLLNLGIRSERTIIGIPNEDTRKIEFWGTEQGGNQINTRFEYEADATYAFREIYKAWQEKKSELTVILKGKNLKEHVNYVRNVLHMPLLAGLVQKQRMLYNAFFSKGWLEIVTPDTQSKETLEILERFAGVFDGTYTRFLDLQKAEAQARESQIEAALERVRSRTMGMQRSGELQGAALLLFQQAETLGVNAFACGFCVWDDDMKATTAWMGTVQGLEPPFKTDSAKDIYLPIYEAAKRGESLYVKELDGRENEEHYAYMATLPVFGDIILKGWTDAGISAPSSQIIHCAFFAQGYLMFISYDSCPEAYDIFKRFAKVFEQTYTRFLDLQRAEAQAREAQIEASLERVRSKAMAMRNSGDLSEAASTVFTELRNLGINPIRSGVGLLSNDTHKAKLYSNTSSSAAGHLSLMGEIDLSRHPVFEQQYQGWLKQENYFVALGGKELTSYYKILSAGLNADLDISVKKHQKEYGHWFMFSEGFLYAWSDKEYTDAELKILERFKNVIELTFRRYIELQKSEAQARDAVRQASLDRVRAEIASMRTISDLDRITPLIWNELTILGVPFIRCGVFIMDEPMQLIHTYLSTPDGKAIAAFQLHFNSDTGNGVNQTALRGWREKQVVTLHWTEEEFKNFSHALVEQGEIASEEGYLTERPPSGLDLHFFPFLQGMLYAGNTEPLSDDDKDLVQSLADAFSTAYARYEDFNRLELAKQEVERTLTDLRTAQTRLIQSEKMASLGELTAGIAHEIQNPLNFVNNFSEVNQDLLEELKAESLKPKAERDEQLEIELINDLINNEQKINHHGKRADGIVKGMLQHSRTAGGEKLLTNINSVAEEYMRLSYHGLRAKDKGFNAEMGMHFDPDLPKIQAVGQDIGRVMLNLFNNAFYAVNQKKKTAATGYNPEVSVSTSAEDEQIIIKVKDNGVGMPDHVKEKIMQPFFTTKPTGEGTGLGLSLTYDMVVKGHGGTIQVNSVEGEGSEFTIQLPIN